MATSQVGIKQLLEAEQKAQEIVNKARKGNDSLIKYYFLINKKINIIYLDRVALLKQAKEEAEKEVAEYKAKRTIEYEAYAKKVFFFFLIYLLYFLFYSIYLVLKIIQNNYLYNQKNKLENKKLILNQIQKK